MGDSRPIGMFDSGVGGLTVARAVLDLLPNESLIYLGDSGRFPYGPKPVEEIRRYALEIAENLVHRRVKTLVVACNSIEVSALEDVGERTGIPVVGVIDPGVRGAVHATITGRIGVIGTQATIESGAYDRALARTGSTATLASQACPSFVEFVERGDTTSDKLRAAAREYLEPLRAARVDALILGCTHYPLISGVIAEVMGPDVALVSSAIETSRDVENVLTRNVMRRNTEEAPTREFLTTGDPAQFRELGQRFLGPEIGDVQNVQLDLTVGGGRP